MYSLVQIIVILSLLVPRFRHRAQGRGRSKRDGTRWRVGGEV